MSIATKNGSVILQSGSVAEGCGCCGSKTCDFSIPPASELMTLAVESSVYGESVFQLPHGALPTSPANAYWSARGNIYFDLLGSNLWAFPYVNYDPYKLGPTPRDPWEGVADYARLNQVGVITTCQRVVSFSAASFNVGPGVNVSFQGFLGFISLTCNFVATVISTDGQIISESRTAVESMSNELFIGLPDGFVIDRVTFFYEFTEWDQRLTELLVPPSETLTFRGFYDAQGNQKMYRFAENYPLP